MRSEGELAIEAYLTPQTSHEGSWCQASMVPALSFFSNSDQLLADVGLWSCGRRTASSKRSGKSTGLLAPYTGGGQRTRFPIKIAAVQ